MVHLNYCAHAEYTKVLEGQYDGGEDADEFMFR